jgi:hypothetical protein
MDSGKRLHLGRVGVRVGQAVSHESVIAIDSIKDWGAVEPREEARHVGVSGA